MEALARNAVQVAEELKGIARESVGAPLLAREGHARHMDTLLEELGRLPGSPEAADALRFLLEVDGFGGLRVPGRMPCRAQAIDVIAGWGYLDLVSESDQEYWRKQAERWSGPRAAPSSRKPERDVPEAKPREPTTALVMVLGANIPAVIIALMLSTVPRHDSYRGGAEFVMGLLILQVLSTVTATLIPGAGRGVRSVCRGILWAAALPYALLGVLICLGTMTPVGLPTLLPAALFYFAAKRV